MFLRSASENRLYHLGPYPLEVCPRDDNVVATQTRRPPIALPAPVPMPTGPFGEAARKYRDLFADLRDGLMAPKIAPLPDDLQRRMIDVKGYCYFLNAAQVAVCDIPDRAWIEGAARSDHAQAVVFLVAHARAPEPDNRAHDWAAHAVGEVADVRAAEIAVCLAGHVGQLGFSARAHFTDHSELDLERLAVLAGLAVEDDGRIRNPFLADGAFTIAAVSSNYPLPVDRPLAAAALRRGKGFAYWKGINGAMSGRERNRRANRATHMSRYPMEQVRRVDQPTTLIIEDEVPRVPKRAAFFERALRGDLGDKAQRERHRFAFKQPHTSGMMAAMRAMVPIQDGAVADVDTSPLTSDPAANSRALKSLSYLLGADLSGICEAKRYTWHSHDSDGQPMEIKHKYAIAMLIDQEYDTMEGASGDDWISGAQSMRGYLRGAEIAGVLAEAIRGLGFSARAQTNVDSDVLHIPLILLAGLGELSRIGELVLNPYVGPRFKSVVLTTDMPLEIDKPIDFGLQYFCGNCWKCARECPCDAISLGDKVVFNGYEMWKPDVERCGRYRLTNSKGSACGRCMKTCPLNKVTTADGPLLTRLASWCGIHAFWLKPLLVPIAVKLDDWVRNGTRNPVKKWWLDLELVDGICVEPVSGTNKRDIDVTRNIDPAKQKMAVYPANVMPVPNDNRPQKVDRKAALAMWANMETPAEAASRAARGEAPPAHYIPTPADPEGSKGPDAKPAVYGGGTGRKAAE